MTAQVNHVSGDDLHLIHRSKLERDWFIHTVASDDRLWFSGADSRSDAQPSGHAAVSSHRAGQPMEDQFGLPSIESRPGSHH
ncbi:MAG: hypothetical protein OJF50_004241 [Nitrospira sp.]|nr:hypothetical protein [Nitrospira sp.]